MCAQNRRALGHPKNESVDVLSGPLMAGRFIFMPASWMRAWREWLAGGDRPAANDALWRRFACDLGGGGLPLPRLQLGPAAHGMAPPVPAGAGGEARIDVVSSPPTPLARASLRTLQLLHRVSRLSVGVLLFPPAADGASANAFAVAMAIARATSRSSAAAVASATAEGVITAAQPWALPLSRGDLKMLLGETPAVAAALRALDDFDRLRLVGDRPGELAIDAASTSPEPAQATAAPDAELLAPAEFATLHAAYAFDGATIEGLAAAAPPVAPASASASSAAAPPPAALPPPPPPLVLKVALAKDAVPDWFDSYGASLRDLPRLPPAAAAAAGACTHAPAPGQPALVITGALPLNIDSACTGRDVHADVLRRNFDAVGRQTWSLQPPLCAWCVGEALALELKSRKACKSGLSLFAVQLGERDAVPSAGGGDGGSTRSELARAAAAASSAAAASPAAAAADAAAEPIVVSAAGGGVETARARPQRNAARRGGAGALAAAMLPRLPLSGLTADSTVYDVKMHILQARDSGAGSSRRGAAALGAHLVPSILYAFVGDGASRQCRQLGDMLTVAQAGLADGDEVFYRMPVACLVDVEQAIDWLPAADNATPAWMPADALNVGASMPPPPGRPSAGSVSAAGFGKSRLSGAGMPRAAPGGAAAATAAAVVDLTR